MDIKQIVDDGHSMLCLRHVKATCAITPDTVTVNWELLMTFSINF